jgi:site-specific recombinase XerD
MFLFTLPITRPKRIASNTDYLFVQDNGAPMNPDSLTDWLSKFSKWHNLPHINPHAFRHTMASVLINSGKDIVSVSKRLGHAKVSTTTDIYSHIIRQADEQASDCLADVLLRTNKKLSG